jgi:hypothetical protein
MDPFTDDPWTRGEQGIPQRADDDPHDLLFQPRWPESLDAAMRCQGCGAEVAWCSARQSRNVFTCPACGKRRWSKNAGKRLRHKTGERDGWACHRCRMPVDQSLAWPHPLSAVADHYPVFRDDGGLCSASPAASRRPSTRFSGSRRSIKGFLIVALPDRPDRAEPPHYRHAPDARHRAARERSAGRRGAPRYQSAADVGIGRPGPVRFHRRTAQHPVAGGPARR